MRIDYLPEEMLVEIISFLVISKSDVLRLSTINRNFYKLVSKSELLYRVLAERDKMFPPSCIANSPYRQLYYEFESIRGFSEVVKFVSFNVEMMKWEINPLILPMISSLEGEVCITTFVDMTKKQSNLFNLILGLDGVFKNDIGDEEPRIDIWLRPFIFKSKRKEKTNVLFVKTNGLFTDCSITLDRRRELNTIISLISSTLIICKNSGQKDWDRKLNDLSSIYNELSVFSHGDVDLRSLLVIEVEEERKLSNQNFQVFDVIQQLQEQKFENQIVRTSLEELLESDNEENNDNNNDENSNNNINNNNNNENEALPFLSLLCHWFGKIHGIKIQSNNESELPNRDDFWVFLYDLTKPLVFSWESIINFNNNNNKNNDKNLIKTNGKLLSFFINHCLVYINDHRLNILLTDTSLDRSFYKKIISSFNRHFLNEEVSNGVDFYSRALTQEFENLKCLCKPPLEMDEIVLIAQNYSFTTLQIFTEQIKSLIVPSGHIIIREYEKQLRRRMNQCFRYFWIKNGEYSEKYCEKIIDSCFKWIDAETLLIDQNLYNNNNRNRNNILFSPYEFKKRFMDSLDIYLKNSKGTRRYSVMSFCCNKYIQNIKKCISNNENNNMNKVFNESIGIVEKKTIQETLKIDEKRTKLQVLDSLKLKFNIIQNSIIRLKNRLKMIEKSTEKNEEWNSIVYDRINKLGLQHQNIKCFHSIRKKLIITCKKAIQIEKEEIDVIDEKIKNFNF